MPNLNYYTIREGVEVEPERIVEHIAATLVQPDGTPIPTVPTSSSVLGATTDAAASSSVAEDTTARTGISLWKGIKNVLILVKDALDTLIAPASLTETTVTVAQGESESGEVDLAGTATVMIYPPAAVEATTAQMSFKVGRVAGSRAQLNDEYGVKLVIPFTAAQPIRVPASMLPAVRYLSIVLETSAGVAVAQATAARDFVFVTRSLMDSSLLTTLDGRRRFVDTFDALRWQTVAGTLTVSGGALQASALGDWGPNLIPNGEFTTDWNGWGAVGATRARVDSSADPGVASGGADNYVLKIVATEDDSSTSYAYTIPPTWPALLGATITARCLMYIPSSNSSVGGQWQIYARPGATLDTYDAWTALSTTQVMSASDPYVRADIGPTGLAIGDALYLDAVCAYRQNAAAIMPFAPNFRARLTHISPAAPSVVPAGWMFRYTDALNYWELRLLPNTDGNDMQIVQVTAGEETVRAEADVGWTAEGTDEIELIVHGPSITTRYRKAGVVWTIGPSYASATQGAQAPYMGPMLYGTTTARWTRVEVDW